MAIGHGVFGKHPVTHPEAATLIFTWGLFETIVVGLAAEEPLAQIVFMFIFAAGNVAYHIVRRPYLEFSENVKETASAGFALFIAIVLLALHQANPDDTDKIKNLATAITALTIVQMLVSSLATLVILVVPLVMLGLDKFDVLPGSRERVERRVASTGAADRQSLAIAASTLAIGSVAASRVSDSAETTEQSTSSTAFSSESSTSESESESSTASGSSNSQSSSS